MPRLARVTLTVGVLLVANLSQTLRAAEGPRLPPTRPGPSPASEQNLAADPIEEAWHNIADAQQGSREAAEAAVARLRAELERQPENARARALLGLAIVLQARDVPLMEKRRLATEGFAEIDAAVAQAPDDADVRLIRATNASQMPRFLERNGIAQSDFRWLLERASETGGLDATLRRRIYYQAGAFALRERRPEAVSLLEHALAIAAADPPSNQIQSMLALARRQLTPPRHAHAEEADQAPAATP